MVQAGQGEVGDLAGGHRAPGPEREAPGPVPVAGRAGDQPRHPDQGPVQVAGSQQAGHPVGVRAQGRVAEAESIESEAVKTADAGGPEEANNLAWFLATCPDPTLRNGSNAVSLIPINEGVGTPVAVTVKPPDDPTANVALPALVMAGAV